MERFSCCWVKGRKYSPKPLNRIERSDHKVTLTGETKKGVLTTNITPKLCENEKKRNLVGTKFFIKIREEDINEKEVNLTEFKQYLDHRATVICLTTADF